MDSDNGLPSGQRDDMTEVLTALLSSRVRYKLLALFVAGEETPRHARQLAKDTGEHFNSIWQELKHLESLGLLESEKVGSQVRYRADPAFPLLPELRQLLRKAQGQASGEPAAGEDTASEPLAVATPTQPQIRPTRPKPAARFVQAFVIGEVD